MVCLNIPEDAILHRKRSSVRFTNNWRKIPFVLIIREAGTVTEPFLHGDEEGTTALRGIQPGCPTQRYLGDNS
jgi:hypothetical protein